MVEWGYFELVPDDGKYEVRIGFDGREYTFRLPEAKPTGYVMRVDSVESDSLEVVLCRNDSTEGCRLGVAVLCRGLAYEFATADLQEKLCDRIKLSTADLPGGVQQITAYTCDGEVVAERLAYHDDGRPGTGSPSRALKRWYRPFEQIKLSLDVTDEKRTSSFYDLVDGGA